MSSENWPNHLPPIGKDENVFVYTKPIQQRVAKPFATGSEGSLHNRKNFYLLDV